MYQVSELSWMLGYPAVSEEDLVVCGDKSLTLMLVSWNETRCCVLCCVGCVTDEKSVWFLLVTKINTKSTRDGDVDAHTLDSTATQVFWLEMVAELSAVGIQRQKNLIWFSVHRCLHLQVDEINWMRRLTPRPERNDSDMLKTLESNYHR